MILVSKKECYGYDFVKIIFFLARNKEITLQSIRKLYVNA